MEHDRFSWKSRFLFTATRLAGWGYYLVRVGARFLLGRRPVGVRRILVARRSRLGDLIVFLPTLAALRARYPHAYIVLGVQQGMSAGALLAGSRDIDELRVLDFLERPSALGRLAGALSLFAEGFDLILTGARYFLLHEVFFSGAPHRLSLDSGAALQVVKTRIFPVDPSRHEAENNLRLVEELGAQIAEPERAPVVRVEDPAAAEEMESMLRRLGVPEEASLIAVHPGAQKPSRRWPAERFAELAARLLDERPGLWIIFTGVPGEARLVDSVRAAMPAALRERAPSSLGLTTLPAMIALLDRSAAFVCNDTGVMHLARARGTPLVVLLGPENDLRWGPHPLGSAPAIALRYPVPCSPCDRWDCPVLYCLRSLGVEQAVAAVGRLLEMPRRVAGGEPAPSLVREITPRNWRALEEAGFELPLVSVVLLPDAFGESRNGASAAAGNSGTALATVERQEYPRLEVIRVEVEANARAEGASTVSGIPVRVVRAPSADAAAAWRAVLDAARGEVIAPLLPGADWPPEKLSADVATLVRHPELPQTDGGSSPLDAAYRRTVLESLLASSRNGASARSARSGMAGWLRRRVVASSPPVASES